MLVILYGTSCVGKSTIMEFLRDNCEWKMISVYMSRKVRPGETGKIHLSVQELIEGERNGVFLPLNCCYGNYYGTPIEELKEAVADHNRFWCLDFPIEKRRLLSSYHHCGIILRPIDVQQLIEQIGSANRTERQAEIIKEYEKLYCGVSYEGLFEIINCPNQSENSAYAVAELARNWWRLEQCRP